MDRSFTITREAGAKSGPRATWGGRGGPAAPPFARDPAPEGAARVGTSFSVHAAGGPALVASVSAELRPGAPAGRFKGAPWRMGERGGALLDAARALKSLSGSSNARPPVGGPVSRPPFAFASCSAPAKQSPRRPDCPRSLLGDRVSAGSGVSGDLFAARVSEWARACGSARTGV